MLLSKLAGCLECNRKEFRPSCALGAFEVPSFASARAPPLTPRQNVSGYWVTVMVAPFDVIPDVVAVTVAVPTATAVASPVVDIVATELGVAFQVEVAVTSAVVPSLYVAVAVN